MLVCVFALRLTYYDNERVCGADCLLVAVISAGSYEKGRREGTGCLHAFSYRIF